jgi:hypothetical protein
VIVRPEAPADYDTIAAVVGAAFADEPVVVDVVTAIGRRPSIGRRSHSSPRRTTRSSAT